MALKKENNIVLHNPETRDFLADAIYPETREKLPLVIFCHGYKGYKDWGAWNLLGEELAKSGLFFVKFNFSFNGTTLEHPSEFGDLEAFGNDNFTKQLSDLQFVMDYFGTRAEVQSENIALIGHSRGGGVVTIKAAEDARVKKLICLAGVDHLDFFPKGERLKHWRENGVFHTVNGRTKQSMPHYYQLYEDFEQHQSRLNVGNHARGYHGRALILHGTHDEAVPLSAAENLHKWLKNSELVLIENAGHTFGTHEPWEKPHLPKYLREATEKMLDFLKS